MSHALKRCTRCGLEVEARAEYCPECRSTDLGIIKGPAVVDPIISHPMDAVPMVRCAFCSRRTAAAEAYHSIHQGLPLCLYCYRREQGIK
jgi:hypothetical protein